MLKITPAASFNRHATLRLEGRIVGPWVAELRQVCEKILDTGRSVRLDLADVSFADHNGIDLLLSLKARGVALMDCSPFMQEELKTQE